MNDETNLSGVQNAPVLPERQNEGQNHVEQTRIPSFLNQPINAPVVPPVVAQETEIEEIEPVDVYSPDLTQTNEQGTTSALSDGVFSSSVLSSVGFSGVSLAVRYSSVFNCRFSITARARP